MISILEWIILLAALVILTFGHTPILTTFMIAVAVIVVARLVGGERIVFTTKV